jgi:hypothetical protein
MHAKAGRIYIRFISEKVTFKTIKGSMVFGNTVVFHINYGKTGLGVDQFHVLISLLNFYRIIAVGFSTDIHQS